MARYLISSGVKVPARLIDRLEALAESQGPCLELVEIHNRLAQLVAPATPRSLVFLAKEEARRSPFDFFGEIPLVRRLMAVALSSTVLLFSVSLSPIVDGRTENFSLLSNSGYSLFLHQLFLVTAASIGACFANLYRVKNYVKDGTFDPVYESSYWIRYILGLLAGTLIALLIPVEAWLASLEGSSDSILQEMGKPTLALLGGFSSAAVYRILDRLVTSLETLVGGDQRDTAAVQERLWEARMSQRETQARLEAAEQMSMRQGPAAPAQLNTDFQDAPPPSAQESSREWDDVEIRPALEEASPSETTPPN
ncbi:MAG TPA: hypothetical protein VLE27_16960 [Thermoanaerobaculia bacterium]|nr:hypothetical protein [Thermoanaerobaculia bacterium]